MNLHSHDIIAIRRVPDTVEVWHITTLYSRGAEAAAFGLLGFFGAGPGWGRVAQEPQRGVLCGGELEPPARGYDQGIAWGDGDRGRKLHSGAWGASPNLAAAFQDVPDFLYSAVPDRTGDLTGSQRDMDHTGPAGAVPPVDEEADLGPVGRGGIGL